MLSLSICLSVCLSVCLSIYLSLMHIPANPTGFSGKITENSHPSRYTGEFIKSTGFSKNRLCTATSRDRTRAEYCKPRADSVLPRVLTSFLLEISVDLATCRLKACYMYLNRLPLLCSCGDSDLVGQVMWK